MFCDEIGGVSDTPPEVAGPLLLLLHTVAVHSDAFRAVMHAPRCSAALPAFLLLALSVLLSRLAHTAIVLSCACRLLPLRFLKVSSLGEHETHKIEIRTLEHQHGPASLNVNCGRAPARRAELPKLSIQPGGR